MNALPVLPGRQQDDNSCDISHIHHSTDHALLQPQLQLAALCKRTSAQVYDRSRPTKVHEINEQCKHKALDSQEFLVLHPAKLGNTDFGVAWCAREHLGSAIGSKRLYLGGGTTNVPRSVLFTKVFALALLTLEFTQESDERAIFHPVDSVQTEDVQRVISHASDLLTCILCRHISRTCQ